MYKARVFTPTNAEYEVIVAIYRAVFPDERQFAVERWREEDEEWPSDFLHQRFVLEHNHQIIGMGSCYEKYWQHQTGVVHLDFHIHSTYQTLEANVQLYEYILDFLRQQSSTLKIIATEAREDRVERIALLQKLGFQPTLRSPRAFLNVPDFNETRFYGLEETLNTQNIYIYTLDELYKLEPAWKQKLYELRWTIVQDVPAIEPPTKPSMTDFEKMILADPALHELAWFIAVDQTNKTTSDNGLFIGMSNVWVNDPTYNRLDTGLTGVLRAYRRMGIATALKVKTVLFAKQMHTQTIETNNEENNPMYALNLHLGFQPRSAWVSYRKQVLDDNAN